MRPIAANVFDPETLLNPVIKPVHCVERGNQKKMNHLVTSIQMLLFLISSFLYFASVKASMLASRRSRAL